MAVKGACVPPSSQMIEYGRNIANEDHANMAIAKRR